MREAIEIFNKLRCVLQTEDNYVPRPYQTIGGMWTTDTYKLNGVTLHVMDEGYSSRLFSERFDVVSTYRNSGDELEFKKGGIDQLKEVLNTADNNPRHITEPERDGQQEQSQ